MVTTDSRQGVIEILDGRGVGPDRDEEPHPHSVWVRTVRMPGG